MTEREEKLVDALISALCPVWQDNGNVNADAVRDSCMQVLADITGKSFGEIETLIENRIDEMQ